MQILQEFLHRLTLSGAAGNGRNFGPKPPFLRFMNDDFDLQDLLSTTALHAPYASPLITRATFSNNSPISFSRMISGGESAIVSPVTRIMMPCSKPFTIAS